MHCLDGRPREWFRGPARHHHPPRFIGQPPSCSSRLWARRSGAIDDTLDQRTVSSDFWVWLNPREDLRIGCDSRNSEVKRTNLVGSHCEGVNVGRFCSVAISQTELPRIRLFRRHVTNHASSTDCRAALFQYSGVADNPCNLKVPEACRTVVGDQNVSLSAKVALSAGSKLKNVFPHWIDTAMHNL